MKPNYIPYRKRTVEQVPPKREVVETDPCNGLCKALNAIIPLVAILIAVVAFCIYRE